MPSSLEKEHVNDTGTYLDREASSSDEMINVHNDGRKCCVAHCFNNLRKRFKVQRMEGCADQPEDNSRCGVRQSLNKKNGSSGMIVILELLRGHLYTPLHDVEEGRC